MTHLRARLLWWVAMVLVVTGAHGLPPLTRERTRAQPHATALATMPMASSVLRSADASTQSSALAPTLAPALAQNSAWAPAQALVQVPTQIPAQAPDQERIPESAQATARALSLVLAQVPIQTRAGGPVPAPRVLRHLPHALLQELRRKRNPSQTVPIMHAEDIGMCKFVVQEDTDPERTPQTIYTATCRQAGCQCGSEGDFRCTQLTSEVRVSYRNGARNQVLYPNSGCICAEKEASDALPGAPQVTL